ncbi:MAG: TolC family protein [candidate division KSB1 bacterium]|nr:TolC family protein [candidate division KSB1 bacterium]
MRRWALLIGSAVLFALSACPAAAGDGDTLRLTLQEAILTALERNPEFTIQRYRPSILRTSVAEQMAAFEPSLTASYSREKSFVQRFLGTRPQPFEMTTRRTGYNAALATSLPTGTLVSFEASMSGTTTNIYLPQYAGSIGFTVTQPLLRGFGFCATLASLRRARLDLEISRYELKALAERLVQDVEASYWGVYLAQRELEIRKQSLDLAERQLAESQERVAVGKLSELELASVRAEVARRRSDLINAESAYEQARLNLLYVLNPEEANWQIVPLPIDPPSLRADSLEPLEVHLELAKRHRPDLAQARLALQQGKLEVARTRNGLLPRLDLLITMGRTSYSRAFKEATPDPSSPFYVLTTGVSFEMPVIDLRARAQYSRALKTREQLELALANMERLVEKDVRSAYIEVQRTRQQIHASQEARALQEKNLQAEVEKFRVGKSTNLLVLQVQRDLVSSQLAEVRAIVDYLSALTNLYVMEGTLLERRGIEVPPEL